MSPTHIPNPSLALKRKIEEHLAEINTQLAFVKEEYPQTQQNVDLMDQADSDIYVQLLQAKSTALLALTQYTR